jgi:hypothetical protein
MHDGSIPPSSTAPENSHLPGALRETRRAGASPSNAPSALSRNFATEMDGGTAPSGRTSRPEDIQVSDPNRHGVWAQDGSRTDGASTRVRANHLKDRSPGNADAPDGARLRHMEDAQEASTREVAGRANSDIATQPSGYPRTGAYRMARFGHCDSNHASRWFGCARIGTYRTRSVSVWS